MSILNDKQIGQKLSRLAFEIIEQNFDQKELFLAGINNNGYRFAALIKKELDKIDTKPFETSLIRVRINPAKPVEDEVVVEMDNQKLKNKTIILIDDVANTGRTLFYAFKPFLKLLIQKMQVAVLVDRKHKSFPVHVDYVGLSFATTLNENIDVNLDKIGKYRVEIT